jgi:O-acetyl-ADP-ribose deacetylase (regulator of RNase III)
MTEREFTVATAKIRFVRGDIADIAADAIVNAANSSLMGGGGVDGAIHRRGGPTILAECKRIRADEWPDGLPPGKAVITSGGNLKAKHVIHTVGPIWRGGGSGEPDLLKQAYQNSLRLAVANGLQTVAFPSISTGAYGYPIREASHVAVRTVRNFLKEEARIDEVIFVLFSEIDLRVYLETAKSELL